MGTRADFYIGTDKDAEWLGSIAWDGYEFAEDNNHPIIKAVTSDEFRKAVSGLADREDFTKPEMGWPWPWNDSRLTDFVYYFEDGKVSWDDRNDWPDMSGIKNVTLGKRSGVMILGTQSQTNIVE